MISLKNGVHLLEYILNLLHDKEYILMISSK